MRAGFVRCVGPLALTVCTALVGCSLLVDPTEGGVDCVASDDGEDPCPDGLVCREGRCQKPPSKPDASEPPDRCADGATDEREDCDGIDNNCDGEVDEGHDFDGDGVTWCGGGVREDADCDDFDAKSGPDQPEVCDGRDNDCDGRVDEEEDGQALCEDGKECLEQSCRTPSCLFEGSSVTCPEGTRCDPSGKCVAGQGCTEGSCEPGEECDGESGTCVGRFKPNGQPCVEHSECLSRSCVPVSALGMRMENERICGESCCKDADCGEDELCFTSGTGARSCLPRSLDPRPSQSEPSCAADSDCERERCVVKGEQRVQGEGFIERDDLFASICSEPVGDMGLVSLCTSDRQCESGVCEVGFGLVLSVCTVPCGSSDDCTASFGPTPVFCRYRPISAFGGSDPDFGAVCVISQDDLVGSGAQGEPCSASFDCRDGACIIGPGEQTGFCADTCCNDSQCDETTRCRPVALGDHYEMRCVP